MPRRLIIKGPQLFKLRYILCELPPERTFNEFTVDPPTPDNNYVLPTIPKIMSRTKDVYIGHSDGCQLFRKISSCHF